MWEDNFIYLQQILRLTKLWSMCRRAMDLSLCLALYFKLKDSWDDVIITVARLSTNNLVLWAMQAVINTAQLWTNNLLPWAIQAVISAVARLSTNNLLPGSY